MAKFYYGGQAVIEGVMMRGQRYMAVAVRAPDGSIVIHEETLNAGIYRHPVMKLPFLRGLVALWDALGLGIKALMFSANVSMEGEEDGKEKAQGAAATTALPLTPVPPSELQNGPSQRRAPDPASQSFSGPAVWTSLLLALGMMIGIFFVLPVLAAGLVTNLANTESTVVHNLVEGGIRIALFIAYIWAIGHMRDIERTFGYHGAEHKTINAYEAGSPLTPERVQSFTLLNPRCGTTFLLIVLVLATLLFVLLGKPPFILLVLSRIVLVPLVAAVAYEFIRLMANLYHLAPVRILMAPGLALQRMTTRPPDLSMIEVAIAALEVVLVADGVMQKEAVPSLALHPQAAEEATATLA